MKQTDTQSIHAALSEVQCKIVAPKGQYNNFGKYRYRSCEDIVTAVKPLLHAAGLTLTLADDIVQIGQRVYVKATATVSNAQGETLATTAYAREEEQKKGMDASQVTGAASSYARKNALNGLFAIDDTKDADALNVTPQYTQAPQQPAAPRQAAPQAAPQPAPQQPDMMQDEVLRAYALPAIEQAQTKDELARIYRDYKPQLGQMQAFIDALAARKKQVAIFLLFLQQQA